MMNINDAVGVIGGVLSIILLAGGVVVFFRGSYNKARIDALRQDIEDYKNRQDQSDRQHNEDTHRIERLEEQVSHMNQENITLRDLVLQRVDITMLSELMKTHHKQSMQHWEDMTAAMNRVAGMIRVAGMKKEDDHG